MFRKVLLFGIALLFAINLLVGCQTGTPKSSTQEEKPKSRYFSSEKSIPKERRAEVVFDIGVDRYLGKERVRLWLPYPVSSENQAITDVKIEGNCSYSGVYAESKFGNDILYAEWIRPAQKPKLTFSFKVDRKEIFRKNFSGQESAFIPPEAEKYMISPSVSICKKAKEVVPVLTAGKDTVLERAEAIYDYVLVNFRRDDSILGCGRGKVSDLFQTRKGKCVDIHSVFNELARTAGIPAKEIFGIRIPPDKEGDMVKAYHCRSEFYLPEFGWVPVDASDVLKFMKKENLTLNDPKVQEKRRYFFGAQNENYIDFGEGRDIVLNPKQAGKPLNYFMYPYAEVDGEPLNFLDQKELKYSVSYKEL